MISMSNKKSEKEENYLTCINVTGCFCEIGPFAAGIACPPVT